MEHDLHAGHGFLNLGAVKQIAFDELHLAGAVRTIRPRAGPQTITPPHLAPALRQRRRDVRSNEPRPASYQTLHSLFPQFNSVLKGAAYSSFSLALTSLPVREV